MFCPLKLLCLTTQGSQQWTRNLEPLLVIAQSQNKVLDVTIKDDDKRALTFIETGIECLLLLCSFSLSD